MTKIIETIFADESRFVGNGRTGLVFYPDGNVVLKHGRAGERKALTKNFSTEVSARDRNGKLHALSFMDFVDPCDGFAPELAAIHIAARDLKDEANSKRCMKQLDSVVAAARRFREYRRTTEHYKLTTWLSVLARELGRVPTPNELGRALYPKKPYSKEVARRVSKLLTQNDLDWLPPSRPGRPKKKNHQNAKVATSFKRQMHFDYLRTGRGRPHID